MKLAILALAGAATALTATPAEARHTHRASHTTCAKWRHGTCVRTLHRRTHTAMVHRAGVRRYRTGYVFGPSYAYTSYDALPNTYVSRYHLNPDYRYVYRDNYIYVVDPKTYAVDRVINAIVH